MINAEKEVLWRTGPISSFPVSCWRPRLCSICWIFLVLLPNNTTLLRIVTPIQHRISLLLVVTIVQDVVIKELHSEGPKIILVISQMPPRPGVWKLPWQASPPWEIDWVTFFVHILLNLDSLTREHRNLCLYNLSLKMGQRMLLVNQVSVTPRFLSKSSTIGIIKEVVTPVGKCQRGWLLSQC